MFRKTLAGIASLLLPWAAYAGYANGTVGQVLVGRLGNQVFIELLNANFADWPCGNPHPNGYRYIFLLTRDGAEAMLSTVLTAQAAGKRLVVVGDGTCTDSLENVQYVILQAT